MQVELQIVIDVLLVEDPKVRGYQLVRCIDLDAIGIRIFYVKYKTCGPGKISG
jgi:hypothetical protein